MNMPELPSFARGRGRVHRPHHDGHAADRGHLELEALPAPQAWRSHHLDLGELVVEAANAIDGVRTKLDTAPEFTRSELRGWRNERNYISSAAGSGRVQPMSARQGFSPVGIVVHWRDLG
jgi:hypothetical protein